MMRFIAALFVLLYHLGILRTGYKGVDLFFVISGFVMYLTLFSANRPTAGHFFVNRFTKIFFLYWIALIAFYIVTPFSINAGILNTILLLPKHYPALRISWSLSFELYFYIVTGAAVYLLPDKYRNIFFVTWLVLSSITILLYLPGYIHIKGTALNFLLGKNTWEFLLGLLSGYLSITVLKPFRVSIVLPASLLLIVLLYVILVPPSKGLSTAIVTGTLCMLLICFMTACEKNMPMPQNPAAVFKILGDASYAMYLFGPVVDTLIPGRSAFAKIAIIIVTTGLSILINQLIENKGLPWCRRMIYRPGG